MMDGVSLSVCLSVCCVPRPNSRTERLKPRLHQRNMLRWFKRGIRKPKIDRWRYNVLIISLGYIYIHTGCS